MNWPNLVTFSRLLITAACFVCLAVIAPERGGSVVADRESYGWWAFWLFVVAAATDFLDGWLARKTGTVTPLGRVADPLADKVLICGVLVMLLDFPEVRAVMAPWCVVVVLAREFLVTTLRGYAESQQFEFPADQLGKLKMVAQCILAGALITLAFGVESNRMLAVWSLWITLALTVVSGANYVFHARRLLLSR